MLQNFGDEYIWRAEKYLLLPVSERAKHDVIDLAFTFIGWDIVDKGYAI